MCFDITSPVFVHKLGWFTLQPYKLTIGHFRQQCAICYVLTTLFKYIDCPIYYHVAYSQIFRGYLVLHYLIKYLFNFNTICNLRICILVALYFYCNFYLLILCIKFKLLLSFRIISVQYLIIIQDIAVYFVWSHRVNSIVKLRNFHFNNKVIPIVNNKGANLSVICHSKQNKQLIVE